MIRKIYIFICLCLLASAGHVTAQMPLSADTALVTRNSSTVKVSTLATGFSTVGLNMNKDLGYLLAQDFKVPAGEVWVINELTVYGYQTGTDTVSTITAAYLQLYRGEPGNGGTVIFGDTMTNRLSGSNFTGIYRQPDDTSTIDRQRPLMAVKIKLVPAVTLSSGTYYAAYAMRGSRGNGPWSPVKVNNNQTNPLNQHALAYTASMWSPVFDGLSTTFHLGLNLIVWGEKQPGTGITPVNRIILEQNIPNPFTGSTDIPFYLTAPCDVQLSIYDILGREITTLLHMQETAGSHMVTFDAARLCAGTYIYVLKANGAVLSKRFQIR